MKPIPYLKRVLGELDKDLRRLPREERIEALDAYKHGLEEGIHDAYPDKFSFDDVDLSKLKRIFRNFYDVGTYVGKQFSSLDTDSAREFLLAQIEKRKQKFSKPSWLEQYYNLFSLQGLFGKEK